MLPVKWRAKDKQNNTIKISSFISAGLKISAADGKNI